MFWRSLTAAIFASLIGHSAMAACSLVYPFTPNCKLPAAGLNAALAGSQNLASGTLLGRTTAGTGAPEQLTTLPSGLTIPAPTLSGTVGGTYTLGGTPTIGGVAATLLSQTVTLNASGTQDNDALIVNVTLPPGSNATLFQNFNHRLFFSGSGTNSAETTATVSYISYGTPGNPPGNYTGPMEAWEASIDNYGFINTFRGALVQPRNQVGGTFTSAIGYDWQPYNYNTSPGSVSNFIGFQCGSLGGTGTVASTTTCFNNTDPIARISTQGHLVFRQSTVPNLSSCGTGSPALDAHASDMSGIITEGTTATGCTLTFNKSFSVNGNNWIPYCVVASVNGAAPPTGVTTTVTTLVISNASASGNQYVYHCFGAL